MAGICQNLQIAEKIKPVGISRIVQREYTGHTMVSYGIHSFRKRPHGDDSRTHLGEASQIKTDDNGFSGMDRQGKRITDYPFSGRNHYLGLTGKSYWRQRAFYDLRAGQSQRLAGFIGGRERCAILQSR